MKRPRNRSRAGKGAKRNFSRTARRSSSRNRRAGPMRGGYRI